MVHNLLRVSDWYSKGQVWGSSPRWIPFSSTDVFFSFQTANVNLINHLYNMYSEAFHPYRKWSNAKGSKGPGIQLPASNRAGATLYPDPILSQGMWSGNETREVVRLLSFVLSLCVSLGEKWCGEQSCFLGLFPKVVRTNSKISIRVFWAGSFWILRDTLTKRLLYPKKFDLVHQTVPPHERVGSGDETRDYLSSSGCHAFGYKF